MPTWLVAVLWQTEMLLSNRDQRPKSPFKANDKFNGSKTLADKEKGNASRPFMRRCFICGSNQHMKSACPRRSQYRPDRTTGREGQGHAQVHACTADITQEWAGHRGMVG